MKIGIDLRPLQNGHKFRGIGEVAKQVTNHILELGARDGHTFLFYEYEGSNPRELLSLPKGLEYEVISQGFDPERDTSKTKLEKVGRAYRTLYGNQVVGSHKADVFLQYDYAAGVPKDTRTLLVKHDLIPYLFWDKYFESAWVPFKNKALRTTLRTIFANYKFIRLLRRGLRDAHVIMAVSENTKKDIEKYFKTSPKKVKPALLGVDIKPAKTTDSATPSNMPTKPYLLFVGAGDARRRVDDLVAAYNNLKAAGHDIQLVLVGENFKKPTDIPNTAVRNEVLGSSYRDDILTMGYVSDEVKQKLFRDALAYVYPTKYEGFGIPVLEAMLLECPIIVYKNSSIPEVGGDHAIYVDDWEGIVDAVVALNNMSENDRRTMLSNARKHAETFTWSKTAQVVYQELVG